MLAVASLLFPASLAIAESRSGISELQIEATATPVIGGSAVPAGKWPDAVAVVGAQGSCTGTLIAPDIVLTAGHCGDAGLTTVIANTTNYNGGGGVRSQIASFTAYPNWETTFDIAIIKLATPITTVTPRPIGASCTFQNFSNNMMVHLVGFGLTDTAGEGNNTTLREATAPVTDPTCSGPGGCSTGAAPAGEFIAGGNGTDSCFGDSGGPVYLDTPRGTMVIAAVSRGLDNSPTPCGGGGIYVRTDKVLQWIEQTAGKPVAKDSCAGGVTPPPDQDEEDPPPGGGDPQNPDDDESGGGSLYPGEITGGCSTNGSSAAGLLLGLAFLGLRRRR
jgi:secreted trypsin-like serine protease